MKISTFKKENLNFIEVSNDSNLKVVFCDLGASIFNIYFHDELMTRNVKYIKDFKIKNCYYGKTIGRTSNRLKGHFCKIDDKAYELLNNEGDNVLHGGTDGLSNQLFNYYYLESDEYVDLIFSYLSPNLESGYPGNVDVKVSYRIYKKIDQLDVNYYAKTDAKTTFSLTNHAFFCLGDTDLTNLKLFINSSKNLDVNRKDLLPIRVIKNNDVMNFKEFKNINKDIENNYLKGKMMNGYDSYFYFDDVDINKVNVSLKNQKYQLDIKTDFEGVQIYSSNYKPDFELDNKNNYRDSVAIEPSDSFLNINLLDVDQIYSRNISYVFK